MCAMGSLCGKELLRCWELFCCNLNTFGNNPPTMNLRQELLKTSKRGRGDVGAAMDREHERLAEEAGAPRFRSF